MYNKYLDIFIQVADTGSFSKVGVKKTDIYLLLQNVGKMSTLLLKPFLLYILVLCLMVLFIQKNFLKMVLSFQIL